MFQPQLQDRLNTNHTAFNGDLGGRPLPLLAMATAEGKSASPKSVLVAGKKEEHRKDIAISIAKLILASFIVSLAGIASLDGLSFTNLLEGWPDENPSVKAKVFYLVDVLAFLVAIPMLILCGRLDTSNMLWRPAVKRNFLIMLLHHIVAVVLLTISYVTNLWKLGVALGLLLQPSEIFLELWSLVRYFDAGYRVRCVVLSLHLVQFVALHLVGFASIVLRASLVQSLPLLLKQRSFTPARITLYVFFNVQLVFLFVATLVWVVFLARLWYRTVFNVPQAPEPKIPSPGMDLAPSSEMNPAGGTQNSL